MTATRFLDLNVVTGPDEGMRYTIEQGTYRVIGRYEDAARTTEQLTSEGDRALNPDQQERIEHHIETHARSTRLKFQRRGPDILLGDPSVSRTHAMVLIDEHGASFADLMSTNKSKVNGNPMQDAKLGEGDVITIGNTRLLVLLG
jgi:hypothetical protein